MARRLRGGLTRGQVLAGAALELAARAGLRLPDLPLLSAWGPPEAVEVPAGAGPDFLGTLHQSFLAAGDRRSRGAFYTPPEVADRLVAWAIDGLDDPVVCDPACGGGAFLLAAARAGSRRLVAIDIDPLAVAVTEAALALHGLTAVTLVGDALLDEWPAVPDVVVGNPPFLGQLSSSTARTTERAAALGARGYVDDAALFLAESARRARHSVALLQPESILGVASASDIRAGLAPLLDRVWLPERRVFDGAAVRVVGVVLRRDRARPPLVDGSRWAPLLADARGVPRVDLGGHGTLGERCTVSAGFRDEYYGLTPFVGEDRPGAAPLVTSGLIDPARSRWGEAPARFARREWTAPAVDLDGIRTSSLAAWAEAQLVPKVLVATQTRVIEAVADEAGAWLPCTPVLSVVPEDIDLWHVLAALLAPPATAWALREAAGAALSGDAVKLSAAQLRALPLPPEGADWDEAADRLRGGDVLGAGAAMCRAHGVDVLDWWAARLPYRGLRA